MTCHYCEQRAKWAATILGMQAMLCAKHMLGMYRDHYDTLDNYSTIRSR